VSTFDTYIDRRALRCVALRCDPIRSDPPDATERNVVVVGEWDAGDGGDGVQTVVVVLCVVVVVVVVVE